MDKCYKKSEGVFVLDFAEPKEQYEVTDTAVTPSNYTPAELEAMESDFFDGSKVGMIQNYAFKLNALAAKVDELNLAGE